MTTKSCLPQCPRNRISKYIHPSKKTAVTVSLLTSTLLVPDRFQTEVVDPVGILKQSLLRQTNRLSFGHVAFLDEL